MIYYYVHCAGSSTPMEAEEVVVSVIVRGKYKIRVLGSGLET